MVAKMAEYRTGLNFPGIPGGKREFPDVDVWPLAMRAGENVTPPRTPLGPYTWAGRFISSEVPL